MLMILKGQISAKFGNILEIIMNSKIKTKIKQNKDCVYKRAAIQQRTCIYVLFDEYTRKKGSIDLTNL